MHSSRVLFFSVLIVVSGFTVCACFGVNYGQVANNLLSPSKSVPLIQRIGATQVKIYDANRDVLCAFANTNIEMVVGLGNEYLLQMIDPLKAHEWVAVNVYRYLPSTKIVSINMGNEVLTSNDISKIKALLPAMQAVYSALVNLSLDKTIRVVSSQSIAILGNSYPPSRGSFKADLLPYIIPFLKFLQQTGSSFYVNAYPYFAYKASPNQISLDYVLFQKSEGTQDVSTKQTYNNMLFAQIDAVNSALAAVGHQKLEVVISETGWPSNGDSDELGANVLNAETYNGNLIRLINQKKTTPLKPSSSLNVYVFALFNENLKPGPLSERNYGLFNANGTPAYSLLEFTGIGSDASNRSENHRRAVPPQQFAIISSPPPSNGYMSISSVPAAADRRDHWIWLLILCGLLLV